MPNASAFCFLNEVMVEIEL